MGNDMDNQNLSVKMTACVLLNNGHVWKEATTQLHDCAVDRRIGFDTFIKRSELMRNEQILSWDGALHIRIKLEVVYKTFPIVIFPTIGQSLSVFHDVVLVDAGKIRYNAHKEFLKRRCAFFAKLFQTNRCVSVSDCVQEILVEDLASRLVNALIRFIYMDYVPLQKGVAEGLLKIAHENSMPDLKHAAETILMCRLNLDNLDEFRALSEVCLSARLKDYVKMYTQMISETSGEGPNAPMYPVPDVHVQNDGYAIF